MSRIGKKPIPIPKNVKIQMNGQHLTVQGPRGTLSREIRPEINVVVDSKEVKVVPQNNHRTTRGLWGLSRTLISNMVVGVSEGFTRDLEVIGVGYKVELKGNAIFLSLGYSHPILFELPEAVKAEVEPKANKIKLMSPDKELLGLTAAKIRAFRGPEPYKGKGIKYSDETIRRKVGKSA